jgi:adenosine deaminase CECR1
MTATEKKAEEIVRRLRKEEEDTIWSVPYEDIPHPFPGMEFLTGMNVNNEKADLKFHSLQIYPGRKIIESTQLFAILRKVWTLFFIPPRYMSSLLHSRCPKGLCFMPICLQP